MGTKVENTRELVLDMLMEILEQGVYSHLVIRDVLDKYDYMDNRDKAFVKRVTEGTLERLIEIDYYLDQISRTPVSKMKPLIRNLMRMSVYQLLYMDSVPEHAVCNEAVKLAAKRGYGGLSGFVNGVLRNLARNRQRLSFQGENELLEGENFSGAEKGLCPEMGKYQYLSIKYSMPQWLIRLWMVTYGEEITYFILKGLLKPQPLTLRFRESLSTKERRQWLASLKKAAIKTEEHPYLPYAVRIWSGAGIRSLPGYQEGLFTVQDVSSMLVAESCGLHQIAGQPLVLDVCACPGGKAMHVAEKLSGRGKVIARDISENKVSLMRDNIKRMGYENIRVQVHDAAVMDESLKEKADVVLADLPCSGLGVIGKKRDIKYRITQEELGELEKLQRRILNVVWRYVKPGGILIYSTCTMNPGENEKMTEWFTQNYPFEREELTPFLPEALRQEGKNGMLQLFPGYHLTDGFFIARLRRR